MNRLVIEPNSIRPFLYVNSRGTLLECLIVFALMTSLSSCFSEPLPPECRDFFSLPTSEEREKEFADFDLDKQLRIQRCGLDLKPQISYAIDIAHRGRSIIPYLLRQLNEMHGANSYSSDKSRYALIQILEDLAESHEIENYAPVELAISNAIEDMQSDSYKQDSVTSLTQIQITDPLSPTHLKMPNK